MRPLALFDLDHTLLPFDTQVLMGNTVLRKWPWRRALLVAALAAGAGRAVRLVGTTGLKRAYLSVLYGLDEGQREALFDDFVGRVVRASLYGEMVAEVERRKAEGAITVLNSASPEAWVRRVGAMLGFDHSIGTRMPGLEVGAGRVGWFPAIVGGNNKRGAKLARMVELGLIEEGAERLSGCHAYSDSTVDLPLLGLGEVVHLVHPSAGLEAASRALGGGDVQVVVHRPGRPYEGPRGAQIASVRQALGLWPRG